MRKLLNYLIFVIFCGFAVNVQAQFSNNSLLGQSNDNVEFLDVADAFTVNFKLADRQLQINWSAEPTYYLYQRQFKYSIDGKDLAINYVTAPLSKFDEIFEEQVNVFYGDLATTIKLPELQSQSLLTVQFQGCTDKGLCYPPTEYYYKIANGSIVQITSNDIANIKANSIASTASTSTARTASTSTARTASTSTARTASTPTARTASTLLMLVFAFIGGLILNIMPCVFPILTIKLMSFVATNKPKAMGWQYTAGVLVSMFILASIILILRSFGSNIGWGFQLQYPPVIVILCILFFVMGLSLLGLFNIGERLSNIGSNKNLSSFGTGVLAVIVASPCTAPFMITALSVALTLPFYSAILLFLALGFGLATPILVLCYFPSAVNKLPKSGVWLQHFKQWMAFPLFITAIWLLSVFYYQTDINATLLLLVGLVIVAFACLLQLQSYKKSALTAVVIAVAAIYFSLNIKVDNNAKTNNFTIKQYQQMLQADSAFFINTTAQWCITCKFNERTVFKTQSFQELLQTTNTNFLTLDFTAKDLEIEKLLKLFNHPGVPLYLYKAENSDSVVVLPQLLSRAVVEKVFIEN